MSAASPWLVVNQSVCGLVTPAVDATDQVAVCGVGLLVRKGCGGQRCPQQQSLRTSVPVTRMGWWRRACRPAGSLGGVNIDWATMQLPIAVIDYVLVPELAHLRHGDHSAAFWRIVLTTRKTGPLNEYGARIWMPESPE